LGSRPPTRRWPAQMTPKHHREINILRGPCSSSFWLPRNLSNYTLQWHNTENSKQVFPK
jgi:hypothetical protein